MITQSNHNTILERVKILTQLRELDNSPNIIADVSDFLYKIKAFDEYESMSMPTDITIDIYDNLVVFEWIGFDPNGKDINTLNISFSGDGSIQLDATYPEMGIYIDSIALQLNEDMANFVTTHLENFKIPLKKKRIK